MVQLSPCVDVFGHSGAGADSSGTKRSLMPPDPGCVQVCMHLCRGVVTVLSRRSFRFQHGRVFHQLGRLLEKDYLRKLVPDICYTSASYLVLTLRLLLLRLLRLQLHSCSSPIPWKFGGLF